MLTKIISPSIGIRIYCIYSQCELIDFWSSFQAFWTFYSSGVGVMI